MKKYISLFLSAVLFVLAFSGCGNDVQIKTDKLSIVTTIFPVYDWVMNILGEKSKSTDVTMLLDSGVDLHSYQPTADDIVKISTCDLFIYVGGESDEWVNDAVKESMKENAVIINLIDILGSSVKEEEIKEGMEAEDGEDEDGEEPELDEHIWLSLRNAAASVHTVADALMKIDSGNSEAYSSNAEAYIEKLNALDIEYSSAVGNARLGTLLFADRFPFRYLVDDYGLEYYAAFAGCSAESEASFETVTFLAGKIDELGLSSVLTIEGANHGIAETVIAASKSGNAGILSMDSMQSVTSVDVENGETYLSIMGKNLEVLKTALS